MRHLFYFSTLNTDSTDISWEDGLFIPQFFFPPPGTTKCCRLDIYQSEMNISG